MDQKLRFVLAQLNPVVGDIELNKAKIIKTLSHYDDLDVKTVVVFPELFLSGYPPEDLLFRDHFCSQIDDALSQIGECTDNVACLLGHPFKSNETVFNSVSYFYQGKIISSYHKQFLPNYGVFDEKRYFSPGDSSHVFDIEGVKVGISICEDIWHESTSERLVEKGVDLILSINASPYSQTKYKERRDHLSRLSSSLSCPIAYLNIVGGQDDLVFDGRSLIFGADGKRLAEANHCSEDIITFEYNKNQIKGPLKLISSKVNEKTDPLDEVYDVLVMALQDYVRKNGFSGVVLGSSGGIDSALTAAIAVDSLGKDNVSTVSMASPYTSKESQSLATELAGLLSIKLIEMPIHDILSSYERQIKSILKDNSNSLTIQNLQARIRANLLMAYANEQGRLLISTGNHSEIAIGYSTLYGDSAGAFCILKDVPKTMVYKLAKFRNLRSRVIPQRIIERPPTAELKENQKDQDDLPPYSQLDEILHHYLVKCLDVKAIISQGHPKHVVEEVPERVYRNEFKRRQAPPGPRLKINAFGRDRRYPITSGYREWT